MAKYLEVAAQANLVAKELVELVPENIRPQVAELAARLVNFGVRCSPRGVQHTVRFNFVRATLKGLPVKVGMVEKTDPRTKRTYNALTTQPIYPAGKVAEAKTEDNGDD